jgi:hypothetical protein
MSKYLLAALSLCMVACDGGFHARGTIFAQDRLISVVISGALVFRAPYLAPWHWRDWFS